MWKLHSTIALAVVLLMATAACAQNLVNNPSFESLWDGGWTRYSVYLSSAQYWHSSWLNWTDGHTGPGYSVTIKHPGYGTPQDDTTPVLCSMYQNVLQPIPAGTYDAYIWVKCGGGGKWDGPGGFDQFVAFHVYCWANTGCTELLSVTRSSNYEFPMPSWTKLALTVQVPAGVQAFSFAFFGQHVDRWPNGWAKFDDAYFARRP